MNMNMSVTSELPRPLMVQTTGALNDAQFADALEQIGATAIHTPDDSAPPEVIVIAQSRPGEFCRRDLEVMQRRWPLASVVALLGSWCEGEIRTCRPCPGVHRLFWYEFPAWWQQQIALRSAGLCPAWSRPVFDAYRTVPRRTTLTPSNRRGVIVIRTANGENADAIADTLRHYNYAVVSAPPGKPVTVVRGASAGIWDGGQLDGREANELRNFVSSLSRDCTPVVALLDFPRLDRCDVARQLGAAAVLGKPWINADLVATIERLEENYSNTAMSHRAA